MSEVTILKIGGSVLTDKSKEGKLNRKEIARIAKEIASGDVRRLILIHGAGSFGHPIAKKFGLDASGRQNYTGAMLTHEMVKELNRAVVKELIENGIAAMPVHPMNCVISSKGRLNKMMTSQIELMMDKGVVPVIHGDVVMDLDWGVSILSGDQMVLHLAQRLNAKRVGVGTDVDGIMDDDGKVITSITPKTFSSIKPLLTASKNVDVTGGMSGKVSELVRLAESGTPSYVFNASKKGNVTAFLEGNVDFGTVIRSD
ncbi:MAG: isopentenyl phosphate kinase [Methanocellales archaeon]|nr:isopentenyl phosphate kinase [Methanocellales archaeon]